MVIITKITKQPGARREVKWFMFSFGPRIGTEQNKQEMELMGVTCHVQQNGSHLEI